jgi:hypothetical protein
MHKDETQFIPKKIYPLRKVLEIIEKRDFCAESCRNMTIVGLVLINEYLGGTMI